MQYNQNMNVYFVRHGQSEGNLKGLHQGPEVPLSQNGKEQAGVLAKRLKNIPIDIIYASPFIRAKETAEIIANELKLPIEYWEDLKERKRPTELEGLHIDDPKAIEIKDQLAKNWLREDWKYSDEETYKELIGRAQLVVNHLLKNHKNQNVLCVSHGTTVKAIVASMIFGERLTLPTLGSLIHHLWIDNTGITHCEYTDKYGWGLLTWNDTTHL